MNELPQVSQRPIRNYWNYSVCFLSKLHCSSSHPQPRRQPPLRLTTDLQRPILAKSTRSNTRIGELSVVFWTTIDRVLHSKLQKFLNFELGLYNYALNSGCVATLRLHG